MSYRAHIYRWANFKTTVGRRPNFIEYLKMGDAPISLNISKILQ